MAGHFSKPDTMSYKIQTPVIRFEYKGALDKGIEQAFTSVSDPERRVALMVKLEAVHQRMLVWEAEADERRAKA